MPTPSQLSISTSVVLRLIKEEKSYHKELQGQHARISKLEEGGEGENAEFILKQEKQGVEETKAIFPQLRDRLQAATEKLEAQLEAAQEAGLDSNVEEITKAKEAISHAKTTEKEI